jgi:glucokinase
MDKPYVIGIDLGGTNTIFGIVDARGTILQSGSIKTGAYPEIDAYVNALTEGLQEIIEKVGGLELIKGIGVGAPMGNYFSGCIENAVNLPWKGIVPLAQLISEKTGGIPVTVTNDANAAAMG